MFRLFRRTPLTANMARIFLRMESNGKTIGGTTRPTNFDKRVLVAMGKYKTAAEVPDEINIDVLNRARSRFRIKYANFGIALTVIFSLIFVYLGKQAAARGENVSINNLEWHEKYNKDKEDQK